MGSSLSAQPGKNSMREVSVAPTDSTPSLSSLLQRLTPSLTKQAHDFSNASLLRKRCLAQYLTPSMTPLRIQRSASLNNTRHLHRRLLPPVNQTRPCYPHLSAELVTDMLICQQYPIARPKHEVIDYKVLALSAQAVRGRLTKALGCLYTTKSRSACYNVAL